LRPSIDASQRAELLHVAAILSSSLNPLELTRLVGLWRRGQRVVNFCADFGDIITQVHSIEQIALKNGASLLKQCR
jgi:hypothetical protein